MEALLSKKSRFSKIFQKWEKMENRNSPGRKSQKYFQKTIDKSLLVCYNKDTEREVTEMQRIYDLVKCWYDRKGIDDQEWKEFCELMLQALMENNQDVLERLKNA